MKPKLARILGALVFLLSFTAAAPSTAETLFQSYFVLIKERALGDWFGLRPWMSSYGLDVKLHYTAEPMYNAAGGEKHGGTYLHNLGADFYWDLEKLGVPNTSLLVKLSNRDGDSVSKDEVAPSEGGNTFVAQEIYGQQTFKVVNAQLNVSLFDDHLDIALGRLVHVDDFTTTPYNCQFVNLAFCGAPRAAFLQNPGAWQVYPTATWGIRGRLDSPDRRWTLLAGVYDADPELREGDPNQKNSNNNGTDWDFGENGVLLAGELQYHNNRDSMTGLSGSFKVGGFWMSEDSEDIGKIDGSTVDGNGFFWLVGHHMLYRERDGADEGLAAFGSFLYSLEDRANDMDYYFSAGLVYTGLLPWESRSRDRTALAYAHGSFSDTIKSARRAQGLPNQKHESVLELNHRFEMGYGLVFQPTLQYIRNPAGTREIPDAFLWGLKIIVSL